MKHLLLMRHAKSSWHPRYATDFERPLNKRGENDAPRVGAWLQEHHPLPEFILSSPAERARQTVTGFLEGSGCQAEVAWDQHIYAASTGTLMAVIRELPDVYERVMVVGHNPGFQNLASALCSRELQMPTAALACIELPVEAWQDVKQGIGNLAWLIVPKQL